MAERAIVEGDPEGAMKLCCGVLNEDPDYVPAIFTVGRIMMKAERHGLAYSLNRRCADLRPQESACWNNAGMCAAAIPGRLDEAEALLRKALKIEPESCAALNNMALVCVHRCDPQAAIAYAERSLAMREDQPEVWESWGYAHLMLGDFAKGWDGYERMVGHSKYRKDIRWGEEPRWRGEAGGKLIVKTEQGIGDEISFASILPDAMRENEITLECDRRLEGLFRRSFPGLEIHGTRTDKRAEWAQERKWDWHALIGSLAWKYRRDAAAFPGRAFLIPDPERRLQWRALLETMPGRKIGVAWTGGLPNTYRSRRSLTLEALAPILKTRGCTFVSLQYRDPTQEIEAFRAKHGIEVKHWARAAQAIDYDDVAALVAELDEVVSTTTAVVHLCGALGKKCTVLVPSKPRWFYGLTGERLPWYESVRMVRQRGLDWGRAIEQVAHGLGH